MSAKDHNERGIVYFEQGQYQKAIEEYKKALQVDPNYYKAWVGMGVVYRKLGDHFKEIECYEKASELNPDNRYFKKEFEEALKKYPLYYKEKKRSPKEHFESATEFYKQNKLQEAMEEYKNALEVDPNYYPAWYNMGHVHGRLGDQRKAIECFKKALEIYPGDRVAWNDYPGGAEIWTTDEWAATAWASIAIAYRRLGDHFKEIEYFEKALELNPDDRHFKKEFKDALKKYPQYREKRLIEAIKALEGVYGNKIPVYEISKQYPLDLDIMYEDIWSLINTEQVKGKIDSKGTMDRKDDFIVLEALTEPVPVDNVQNIPCVECDTLLRVFIPPDVLAGRGQYQTVKTCPKCKKKMSIAVLKAPDGSLNWQIGEAM